MNLLKCLLKDNDCYRANQWITPKGVMVHSTGANNPLVRRYVQPGPGEEGYDRLLAQLGRNQNRNDWNRSGTNACVHAFIGKLADGSVAAVQTLPWNMRGWHAGNGTTKPSANNSHISFEICEDGLADPAYFQAVYREAVELTAMLCQSYGLDPLAPEAVICHSEGHRLGMASGHADVEHWFPKFGKSMDDFRRDVAEEMEENGMTQEKFEEMLKAALSKLEKERDLLPPSDWSAAARSWAEGSGLIQGKGDLDGDGESDFAYRAPLTREEYVELQFRQKQKEEGHD